MWSLGCFSTRIGWRWLLFWFRASTGDRFLRLDIFLRHSRCSGWVSIWIQGSLADWQCTLNLGTDLYATKSLRRFQRRWLFLVAYNLFVLIVKAMYKVRVLALEVPYTSFEFPNLLDYVQLSAKFSRQPCAISVSYFLVGYKSFWALAVQLNCSRIFLSSMKSLPFVSSFDVSDRLTLWQQERIRVADFSSSNARCKQHNDWRGNIPDGSCVVHTVGRPIFLWH